MAFWIRLWPFGKQNRPQSSNPDPARSSDPSNSSSAPPAVASNEARKPGFLKRAGGWVSGTLEQPVKDATEYARRTGRAMANDALAQAKVKVLVSRMQRDLEEHATICREQVATLRTKNFADREVLSISYLRAFTLTDELRRHVISYAEDMQRPDLAQFLIPMSRRPANARPASSATDPATDPNARAVVPLTEPTEAVALAPPLVFPDARNMGRGYIKCRGTELAGIYQQMLSTMEGIERDLHKARRISALEVVTLVRRLNQLVVQMLREEIAFGFEMKESDPVVVVALDTLQRNISGR